MPAIDPRSLSPEEQEAYHVSREQLVSLIKYDKTSVQGTTRPKDLAWLVKRPVQQILVQIVRDGGENNLHYHTASETTWLVLKGRAEFHGIGDKLLADIGPMEGIHIPGGARYRFAKAGDEDLEILQIVSVEDVEAGEERINLSAHREWMSGDAQLTKY